MEYSAAICTPLHFLGPMPNPSMLDDLYEHAPCGFHSLDSNGVIIRINDTELEWLGYDREEVVGRMKWTDIVTPESRRTFEQHFPRLLSDGSVRDLEFEVVRKDGTLLPVLVSATAMHDEKGNFQMSSSVVYDLTYRKQADSRFRAVLEAAPDALLMCNRKGEVILTNSQIEKIFGYRPDELRGRNFTVLLPERLRSVHAEHAEGFFCNPAQRQMGASKRLSGLRKDGSEIPVEISLSPLHTEDGLVALAGIRDVSERRRTEDEREKLIAELKQAVEKVKLLSGLLSICASCKRIRDEEGHWESLEIYIRDRSSANFSHSICPDCVRKLYPKTDG